MAISYQEERQLFNLMQDYVNTARKSNAFINSAKKHGELAEKVAFRITRLRYMSIEQAKAYIDYKTGRFKPGEYMTYCVDEELQKLFKELEAVTTEVNKYPWKTYEESVIAVANKKKELQDLVSKIRTQPGGQELIDRLQKQVK